MVWLSEEQRSFYASHGYIVMKSLYSRSECAQMVAAAARAESRVAVAVRNFPKLHACVMNHSHMTEAPLPTHWKVVFLLDSHSVVHTWARAGGGSGEHN